MQSNLTISLCITCYQKDYHFLSGVLEQIRNLTDLPDEIVIASSGLSETQLTHPSCLQNDKQIIPIVAVNSAGSRLPGWARNTAGLASNMDIVLFLDIDDVIHPQKIKWIRQIFNDYDCDMLVHNYTLPPFEPFIIYDKLDRIEKITQVAPNCVNLRTEHNEGITHGHITIKRKILDHIKYNENRKVGEDGEFCQQVFHNSYNIWYCNYPLIYYNKVNK
jgi:glycosyltransferase involved in cell wall biosynthesis